MAFGGDSLLNSIIMKFYNASPNRFRGNGLSNRINYTYAVTTPPIWRLIANVPGHNIEIDLNVRVTADPAGINFDSVVPMRAVGTIAINAGVLSITNLVLSNIAANPIDAIVVGIINTTVIPSLSNTLASVPLPQFNNLFGTGLSALISTGRVINGPSLEVGSRITGRGGLADAATPPMPELQALNQFPNAIATVSDDAVNILIRNFLPRLSTSFSERGSRASFGAGIRGEVHATTPVINIAGGNATIQTTISLTDLEGGIRLPVWGWSWVNLPSPPNVNVIVNHSLSVVENRVVITLTGVQSISVNLNFPAILDPVESVLERLINTVLRAFRTLIGDAIRGTKFGIFKLSTNLLNNNLSTRLSIAQGGLQYFGNSVKATFSIS